MALTSESPPETLASKASCSPKELQPKTRPNPISPAYALCLRNIHDDYLDEGFKNSLEIVKVKKLTYTATSKSVGKRIYALGIHQYQHLDPTLPPQEMKNSSSTWGLSFTRHQTEHRRGLLPQQCCIGINKGVPHPKTTPHLYPRIGDLRHYPLHRRKYSKEKLLELRIVLERERRMLLNRLMLEKSRLKQNGEDYGSIKYKAICLGAPENGPWTRRENTKMFRTHLSLILEAEWTWDIKKREWSKEHNTNRATWEDRVLVRFSRHVACGDSETHGTFTGIANETPNQKAEADTETNMVDEGLEMKSDEEMLTEGTGDRSHEGNGRPRQLIHHDLNTDDRLDKPSHQERSTRCLAFSSQRSKFWFGNA